MGRIKDSDNLLRFLLGVGRKWGGEHPKKDSGHSLLRIEYESNEILWRSPEGILAICDTGFS